MRVITELPNSNQRLRCGRCGNLTRFDVVRTATTKEFWHLEIAGEPQVEEVEVQSSKLVSISCRWCGAIDEVELVERLEIE